MIYLKVQFQLSDQLQCYAEVICGREYDSKLPPAGADASDLGPYPTI